jgi:hypothetical protein
VDSIGLSFGAVVSDPAIRDTAESYIYKQSPDQFNADGSSNRIHPGQIINIWLGVQRPVRNADSARMQAAPNTY